MAIEWRFRATALGNCNCAYGCPCQFNALPKHGDCRAAYSLQIEEGHFGAVRLDGLRAVGLLSFPGAVHEGNGTRGYSVIGGTPERMDTGRATDSDRLLAGAQNPSAARGKPQ